MEFFEKSLKSLFDLIWVIWEKSFFHNFFVYHWKFDTKKRWFLTFFETLQNFDSFLKTNFLKFFSKKSLSILHIWVEKLVFFEIHNLNLFDIFWKKVDFLTFSYLWENHGKGPQKKVIFDVFHISLMSIFDIIWVIWWDPVFLWMFCTIGKLVWINTKFCETMKCLKNHYPNSITNLIYFLKTKISYK